MKSVKRILKNKFGEGHLDTGVKIVIAVVIGVFVSEIPSKGAITKRKRWMVEEIIL